MKKLLFLLFFPACLTAQTIKIEHVDTVWYDPGEHPQTLAISSSTVYAERESVAETVDSSLIGLVSYWDASYENNKDSAVWNATTITVSSVNGTIVTTSNGASFVAGNAIKFGSASATNYYTIASKSGNDLTFTQAVTASETDELFKACISSITDMSDSSNHLTQTTTSKQLQYLWLGTDSVRFYSTGTTSECMNMAQTLNIGTEHTLVFHIKPTITATHALIGQQAASENFIYSNSTRKVGYRSNNTALTSDQNIFPNSKSILVITRKESTVEIYNNGVLVATLTPSTQNPLTGLNLLFSRNGGLFYSGEVYSVRVYNRYMPITQVQEFFTMNIPEYIYDYVALGSLSGTTDQIYARAQEDIGVIPTEAKLITRPTQEYNISDNFIVLNYNDFFESDADITMPLGTKYGYYQTFNTQASPSSEFSMPTYTTLFRLKNAERLGNEVDFHGYFHQKHWMSAPLADGFTTPSNSQMRTARADGTNSFGFNATTGSIASNMVEFLTWFPLSTSITNAHWEDLTDAQCDSIRKWYSVFRQPIANNSSTGDAWHNTLQVLDTLSNKYCGTTGKSVLSDYSDTRVPNTSGGVYPSSDNRVRGGIFQGAATLQNQEIWERLITIDNAYKKEYMGKLSNTVSGEDPGGVSLKYKEESWTSVKPMYFDSARTKLASSAAVFYCSINDSSRSLYDVFRAAGYKNVSFGYSGMGFGTSSDRITKYTSQNYLKKNLSYSNIDFMGGGMRTNLCIVNPSISEADQESILDSADVLKEVYEYFKNKPGEANNRGAANLYAAMNSIVDQFATGCIVQATADTHLGDNPDGADVGAGSHSLLLEAMFQFFKRANIKVITRKQAIQLALDSIYRPVNWFPNPNFRILLSEVFDSDSIPNIPDGWTKGEQVLEDSEYVLQFAPSTFPSQATINQFATIPGTYNYSIKIKGKGRFNIFTMSNKNTLSSSLVTINADSEDYLTYTGTFTIPNNTLEVYSTPTTPVEECYQNYFKGYGDKVSHLYITLTCSTSGDELTIKQPVFTIN